MSLQNRINKLLIEASINQKISYQITKNYAERGSQIISKKSLYNLLDSFHFTDEEDNLMIDLISLCIEGGILDEKINSSVE